MKDMTRRARFHSTERKYDTIAYKFQHVLKSDDGKPGIVVVLEQWDSPNEEQLGPGEYEVTIKKVIVNEP